MKKIFKLLIIIPCLFLLSSCYMFTYFDFVDFVQKNGNGYEGHLIIHEENSLNKEAEYVAFYDQYYDEGGIYVNGRSNDLYYYTQLVFNDDTTARSFLRFEVGYSSTTKVYDILGIVEHSNCKKGYVKIDEAFYSLYDKTKESYMNAYNNLCLSTIVDILDVIETVINPELGKTMKDWGFSY